MTSSSLLHWFPSIMATYVMDLVTPVWNIFLTNTPLYPHTFLTLDHCILTESHHTLTLYTTHQNTLHAILVIPNCSAQICERNGKL